MSTRVKVTGLSPKTTQLLRARTTLQQHEKTISIGRTIAQFEMDQAQVMNLLIHLISEEITGSGASSKEVKRLRDLRSRVNYPGLEGSGVTIFEEKDAERERLLDLIAELYVGSSQDYRDELFQLNKLAGREHPQHLMDRDEFRAWIAEKL